MNTLGLKRPVHSFGLGFLGGVVVDLSPAAEIILDRRDFYFAPDQRRSDFHLDGRYQAFTLSDRVDITLLERGDVFVLELRGTEVDLVKRGAQLLVYGDDFILDKRGQTILFGKRASSLILENRGVGFDLTPRGKLN
jgi:hypothetical protein